MDQSDIILIISGIILIGLLPINILASSILYRLSRTNAGRISKSLGERTRVSILLTAAASLGAVIGVYRIAVTFGNAPAAAIQPLPSVLVTIMVILISLPSILWVIDYMRDWFS
jgi:hypothetical protein